MVILTYTKQITKLNELANFYFLILVAIRFSITILLESGSFEITESGSLVAKGYIQKPDNIRNQFLPLPKLETVSNYQLNTAEIYSEFNIRGYNYKGEFCGIKSSDDCGMRQALNLQLFCSFFSFISHNKKFDSLFRNIW